MKNIPTWFAVGQEFDCEDDVHRQEAFICEFHGFDLPRFDLWLLSLPDSELRSEMLERRKLAIEALGENNHDVADRHLEHMLTIQRSEQYILPLARHAESVKKKRRKILSQARKHRVPAHDWEAVAKLEASLLAAGKATRSLAGIIESRLGVPKTTYRAWRKRKATA